MDSNKRVLINIAKKIEDQDALTPQEIAFFLTFNKSPSDSLPLKILKRSTLPLSLLLGFLFATFPQYFEHLISQMPRWTNLNAQLLTGVDYLWNLIGEPIGKANVLYHLPNVVLYSFGILGIKNLIDTLDRRTWLDRVFAAQKQLRDNVDRGLLHLRMKKGHSLLFVGLGDFVGMQFALNHEPNETVTISLTKPIYTDTWNQYNVDTLYDDLKKVIARSSGKNSGEYIFFPVKDDQIFLPGDKAYDLSPHKLDILCQNIRMIEKELEWETKRIIIIGDKFHKSFVQSEDQHGVIAKSEDTISLASIARKYRSVTLLDPSDIVLSKIIEISHGRKIVFRATKEGIIEYKKRFYDRLHMLGYKPAGTEKGILTIGYDIFEDQTEQQTLSRKIDDYYPVVLSKNVRDALLRNGYKKTEFLYVPDLVLHTLKKEAAKQ